MSAYLTSTGSPPPARYASLLRFVSQESSADVVLEALNTGAAAYVAKIDLLHLLTAVDAVLDGRQFVSTALLEKL